MRWLSCGWRGLSSLVLVSLLAACGGGEPGGSASPAAADRAQAADAAVSAARKTVQAAFSSDWTACAVENAACAFSGQRVVRYGTESWYVDKVVSDGTACTNEVFGDPIPGQVKGCWVSAQAAVDTWLSCAGEGQACAVTGPAVVRYGALGKYVLRDVDAAGSVSCTNATFGDPAPGVVKACQVAVGKVNDWVPCASEQGQCTFSGFRTVRYGANDKFATRTLSDGAACTNAVFGDPIVGVAKQCWVSTAALNAQEQLVVRARGTMLAGVGPQMVVRVNGVVVATLMVQSTVPADYVITVPGLKIGDKIDVAFTNDASANGEDRNLFISYLRVGDQTFFPTTPGTLLDKGSAAKAFDGLDTVAGQGELYSNGALRLTWPTASLPATDSQQARRGQAARLLQQASFGATAGELQRLMSMTDAAWVNEQIAKPVSAEFVPFVQRQWDQGTAFRPGGSSYDSLSPVRYFWNTVATGDDQLRKRMLWSLHQIFMVSQADSNLYSHTRAYANYLDALNRNAFGSYRTLLEDVTLSPVMGIYLSHIRNRKEDAATGRVPDENYAREVMQLFSIGLSELNPDGAPKLGSDGKAIDTYTNADVMAFAKVFTGWSWGFPDAQLTENNFRYGSPNYAVDKDVQIDLQRMKAYPNQSSTAEKVLFAGKPWSVRIPAGTSAAESLRLALDALYNHPNVGPFIGKQLIQRLVTSNPSPAYVARVAAAFDNNGQGVRGDLGAVVRAILLDTEARQAPTGNFGKLREPVLRVASWIRAFGVTSVTGNYLMVGDLDGVSQRPFSAPSVFSYFRPGYVPPNTLLADAGAPAPEFQLLNESTAPVWVNLAENMAGNGLGWTGSARDMVPNVAALQAMVTAGNVDGLIEQLNQLLFAGRMSKALRTDLLDSVAGVSGVTEAAQLNRVRVAVFVALSSPEFLVQR